MYEPNPNFSQAFQAEISTRLVAGAKAAAAQLKENVSGQGRSGRKWPDLPYRSSAPGEYPTEQFGDLKEGVFYDLKSSTEAEVGFEDDLEKLLHLEFDPASLGGRKPLTRTMLDPETLERMRQAMEEV